MTPPSPTGTTGAPKTAPDRAVRLHPFTLACQAAGIAHRCLRPRRPHLNGKVERSHRIDTEEFYRVRRCRTVAELQKQHRRFNAFYNTARPHGGHGGLTPLERLRAFPPYRGLRRLALCAGAPPARAPLRSRPRSGGDGGSIWNPCLTGLQIQLICDLPLSQNRIWTWRSWLRAVKG